MNRKDYELEIDEIKDLVDGDLRRDVEYHLDQMVGYIDQLEYRIICLSGLEDENARIMDDNSTLEDEKDSLETEVYNLRKEIEELKK